MLYAPNIVIVYQKLNSVYKELNKIISRKKKELQLKDSLSWQVKYHKKKQLSERHSQGPVQQKRIYKLKASKSFSFTYLYY